MELTVSGRTKKLKNFQPISDEVDAAFKNFYTRCLRDPTSDREDRFGRICQVYLPELDRFLLDLLNKNPENWSLHDSYFTNVGWGWNLILSNGGIDFAQAFWRRALEPAWQWEDATNGRAHKGTPYYFWGGTALLNGKIDNAFFLIHAAYEEDVLTHRNPLPHTPAFYFVTLDFSNQKQAWLSLVEQYAKFLDLFFVDYRTAKNSQLTLDDFRKKFLAHPPSRDIVFLFTHTLARLHQLVNQNERFLRSAFAGQYMLNLLFDLTLVTDEAIHQHNNAENRFIRHALFLSSQAGLSLSLQTLGDLNGDAQKDFDGTITRVLDNSENRINSELEKNIVMTYLIRNRAAHNLAITGIISSRFNEILQSVFSCLFLTVETLY